MNSLLVFGALVLLSYLIGKVFEVFNFPRIVAYILVGVVFSPHTQSLLPESILTESNNILSFCLAVITFEVGGELRWKSLEKSRKEIISITLLTIWAKTIPNKSFVSFF